MPKNSRNLFWQLLSVISVTSCLVISSTAIAYSDFADDEFASLFGEFPQDKEVNTAVQNETSQSGAVSSSPLAHDLLLHKNSIKRMDDAITRLKKIVKSGGWPTLKPKGTRLKLGDQNKEVVALKKQLIKQGDLKSELQHFANSFDDDLERALINYQKRHGLRQSGFVDRLTRRALAISARTRLKQMQTNKTRLKKALKSKKGKRYIVVNVPDYTLQAVNNDKIELISRVVVGRNDRQTPVINSTIYGVNFNPYWHVPQSLVVEDLIPQQLKNPKFIEDQKLQIFNKWGGKTINPKTINWRSAAARSYKFRQQPGDHNALGLIRIHMPNAQNVYLHDTPTKKLYALRARAYSAGCVRVEKIRDVADWILKDQKKWSRTKIQETIKSGKRIDAMFKKGLPVQFVYVTSWVDSKGKQHFRNDIYEKDPKVSHVAHKPKKKIKQTSLSP